MPTRMTLGSHVVQEIKHQSQHNFLLSQRQIFSDCHIVATLLMDKHSFGRAISTGTHRQDEVLPRSNKPICFTSRPRSKMVKVVKVSNKFGMGIHGYLGINLYCPTYGHGNGSKLGPIICDATGVGNFHHLSTLLGVSPRKSSSCPPPSQAHPTTLHDPRHRAGSGRISNPPETHMVYNL